MGLQMALRLQQSLSKQGQSPNLIAWNRTLSKAEPLTKIGAETVEHPSGKPIPPNCIGGRLASGLCLDRLTLAPSWNCRLRDLSARNPWSPIVEASFVCPWPFGNAAALL